MCEHHEENNKQIVPRVIGALVLFGLGFLFKPLFVAAYLIAGYDVVIKAVKHIFKGKFFDENFLMALATAGAFAIGEYPEAVMVMVLYQIGEYFQDRAVDKSRDSISELMDIRPDYANLCDGGRVNPSEVKINDIIIVNTGEKIPLDGVVIEGSASIDTSSLTGESLPRRITPGDDAISGAINLDGVLKIRVQKEFGESTASKILELVEHASSKKAKSENFITRFAAYYTPFVVIMALFMAFVLPLFWDGNWVERALTFLVISCPCALVISVPLTFFAGIGAASQNGILVKGSSYLEALARPGVVVFDKTGTLTKGVFTVQEIHSENPDRLIKYAAYAESASSHPIALAIRRAYGKDIPEQCNIKEVAGKGVKAIVEGKEVLAGSAKFVNTSPFECVGSVVYVSIDGQYDGYIVISDVLKSDSKSAVEGINKLGADVAMLTGDSCCAARKISGELGISCVYSELLPENKVEKLEEIISHSDRTVIFAGDGINDAPVLTRADVGIAMGALGSDAAIEAADVVIMDDKPSKIVLSVKIARKTLGIVKQNIVFALGIKALFLILGAMGMITMWGAVFADVGVSLIAVLNSLRALKIDSPE